MNKTIKKLIENILKVEKCLPNQGFNFENEVCYHIMNDQNKEKCFINSQGMWETKEVDHNKKRHIFYFRLDETYQRGTDDKEKWYENSDTEKLMLEENGLQYFWTWTHWNNPTETCWGVSNSPLVIQIRKDNKVLFQTKNTVWGHDRVSKAFHELSNFLDQYESGVSLDEIRHLDDMGLSDEQMELRDDLRVLGFTK